MSTKDPDPKGRPVLVALRMALFVSSSWVFLTKTRFAKIPKFGE
jgi:hypothetical protein